MKDQLLHAPIGCFRGVHFVIRGAGELVRAGKLLQLATGTANDSEHLTVERNFEDSSWISKLSNEKHLVGAGRDAD